MKDAKKAVFFAPGHGAGSRTLQTVSASMPKQAAIDRSSSAW